MADAVDVEALARLLASHEVTPRRTSTGGPVRASGSGFICIAEGCPWQGSWMESRRHQVEVLLRSGLLVSARSVQELAEELDTQKVTAPNGAFGTSAEFAYGDAALRARSLVARERVRLLGDDDEIDTWRNFRLAAPGTPCPKGPHRGPQGPNEDIAQCGICWMPTYSMRPEGETFGEHLSDCSLPERHEGYCQPGGDGHPPSRKVRG